MGPLEKSHTGRVATSTAQSRTNRVADSSQCLA